MRLERLIPGPYRIAVVARACRLPVRRHLRLIREVGECFPVGPDHQANDVVGALPVEPVFVIEGHRAAFLLIALGGEEPPLGRRARAWYCAADSGSLASGCPVCAGAEPALPSSKMTAQALSKRFDIEASLGFGGSNAPNSSPL